MITINRNHIYQNMNRFRVFAQRSFANVPEKHSIDPMVPKLNLPPEYAKLYDIKQEPGFVVINGRRYPYPYPGIHGEYNYLDMLEKWRSEGKVDRNNRPIFWKMKGMEKIRAKQLWFQRDPTTPVWKLGKYDNVWNKLVVTGAIFMAMYFMYWFYRVVVSKEKDIFNPKYWERRRKEAHH